MGSLILLLLVIDRRAKVAARNRAAQTAAKLVQEQQEDVAARLADLRQRRQAAHDELQRQHEEAQAQLQDLNEQYQTAVVGVRNAHQHERNLQEKLRAEIARLEQTGKELDSQRTALAQSKSQIETSHSELARMSADLDALERALAELKAARQREERTYSLVPYRGKHGDNRKPLYIECAASGLIFHPDRKLIPEAKEMAVAARAEIERRIGGSRSNTPTDGKTEAAPYLYLLVRPDGIPAYYRVQSAIQGLGVDFGYEFINEDWALDFPEKEDALPNQPWMQARGSSKTAPKPDGKPGQAPAQAAGSSPTRVQGLLSSTTPASPGAATSSGDPSAGPGGKPGGTGLGPMIAVGTGTYSPSTGGIPGSSPAGTGSGGVGKATGQAGQGGTSGGPGSLNAALSLAPPRTEPANGQGGGPFPGNGTQENARPQTAGPTAPLAGDADTKKPTTSSKGTAPSSAQATTRPPGSAPAKPTVADGSLAASSPYLQPAPGKQPGASAENTAAGGKQPVASADSAVAGSKGSPSKSKAPSTAGSTGTPDDGTEADASPVQPPRLPGAPAPKSGKAPPPRPFLLNRVREWVIVIDCTTDSVILSPTGLHIATDSLLSDPRAGTTLAEAVHQLVDQRQAAVRPGDPPFRPQIRFDVHPNGLRTYHLVYPALEALQLPMTRQNLEPEVPSTPGERGPSAPARPGGGSALPPTKP
jgi:hypothetical protein